MVVLGLIGWVIGSFVPSWGPGSCRQNTQADLGQMLRTAGFAQAAGVFGIVGVVRSWVTSRASSWASGFSSL
jgi:hypothetical protein